MKILVVSNMYPGKNPRYPYAGVFVKEQVDVLRALKGNAAVDVLIIEGFRGGLHYLKGYFHAWWKSWRGGYDVVHIHYGLTAAFIFWLPEAIRKKVVVTLHGGDILIQQGLKTQVEITRRSIALAGLVLGVSDEIAGAARPYARNVAVLPCGVDDDFFAPAQPHPRVSVIFPGDPARAVKNYPEFEAVIEAYRRTYGPVEVVVLHRLSREEVRNAMQSCTALLLTSISEGSPQVVKEALACDMAVVSSNVGDVRALLDSTPGTAVYAPGSSPDEIARLLNASIETSRVSKGFRRARISAAGMSNRQVVMRLDDVYARLSLQGGWQ